MAIIRLVGNTVFLYLDDMLIVYRHVEEHEMKLRHVFQRLSDAGLTINAKKCLLFHRPVEYLGHIINSDSISPNSIRVKKYIDFPFPKDIRRIKSFLGFAGF